MAIIQAHIKPASSAGSRMPAIATAALMGILLNAIFLIFPPRKEEAEKVGSWNNTGALSCACDARAGGWQ